VGCPSQRERAASRICALTSCGWLAPRPRSFWPPAGTSSCSAGSTRPTGRERLLSCQHAQGRDGVRSYPWHAEGMVSTLFWKRRHAARGIWLIKLHLKLVRDRRTPLRRAPWAIQRVRLARYPQEIRRKANSRHALRRRNENTQNTFAVNGGSKPLGGTPI
jgi:hypothetical protein